MSPGSSEKTGCFGCRDVASRGREIRREAPRVSRLEDAPLEQHDRGAIGLAPDRPAGRLEQSVHGRIDDRVIVALRESELPRVVVSQGFAFDARRAEWEAPP